jgi:hypothetical protein
MFAQLMPKIFPRVDKRVDKEIGSPLVPVERLNGINARLIFSLYPNLI